MGKKSVEVKDIEDVKNGYLRNYKQIQRTTTASTTTRAPHKKAKASKGQGRRSSSGRQGRGARKVKGLAKYKEIGRSTTVPMKKSVPSTVGPSRTSVEEISDMEILAMINEVELMKVKPEE
jgi:hypothetical protein